MSSSSGQSPSKTRSTGASKSRSYKVQAIKEEETPKEKKPPSKYMLHLIKLNFIDMVHRYDMHQKVKRMEALKLTRQHLRKRFMRLYRMFRHKKYGEPLEDQTTWNLEDDDGFGFGIDKVYIPKELLDEEAMIYKKIEDLKKALAGEKDKSPGRQTISDLHTVKEDDYDEEHDDDEFGAIDPNLNPNKFVRSQGEYEEHVIKIVETSVIVNELKEYMKKT